MTGDELLAIAIVELLRNEAGPHEMTAEECMDRVFEVDTKAAVKIIADELRILRQPSPTMMPDAGKMSYKQKILLAVGANGQDAACEVLSLPQFWFSENDSRELAYQIVLKICDKLRNDERFDELTAISCDAFRNWMGGAGERTLPELPEGWALHSMQQAWLYSGQQFIWRTVLYRPFAPCGSIPGEGPTPRAAVLAAIANIKTEG